MPESTPAACAERLLELLVAVPSFAEEAIYVYGVMERFSDHVHARIGSDGRTAEVRSYFAWVEELAQQRDPMVDNLIGVAFLEAAPWGRLGASSLLGSATRALVAQINPDHFDTTGL